MRYVTSIERRAIQKGIEQGIEQGEVKALRESIGEILAVRFQSVPDESTAQIAKVTELEPLKGLLRHAAVVGSIEEFEHLLETKP